MGFLPASFAAMMALATATQAALPTVTAVYAGSDCSVYPGYDSSTGLSGDFHLETNSCTNPAIEGFGATVDTVYVEGDDELVEGYITIVSDNTEAKVVIQCNVGGILEAWTPSGVSGYAWNQINITDVPGAALLMWGVPEVAAIPVEPYYHYIDGVQQPGLFLGSHNVTAWGISYEEANSGSGGDPYWSIRLLGPGTALGDGEYETFIMVNDD